MSNRNHANYLSSFKYDDVEDSSETWTSGNTKTITNAHVRANSFIPDFMHTSAFNGSWHISAISNGSFTITSSDAESGATFKYRIL